MFNNFRILFMINAFINQIDKSVVINVESFIKEDETSALNLVKFFEDKFNPNNSKIINVVLNPLPKYKKFTEVVFHLFSFCIVRTNYFLNKSYISFKVDLNKMDLNLISVPKPITFKEIFVWNEEFEAIHLRFGKIARGGLRWSDRKDDFRTEVLGLVKTQNTKNTVIVPVGSKGGFVIKKDVSGLSREDFLEYGKTCYRNFLSGCLDITDNVIEGKVVHPENVKIFDEEDPYFVVAADKGTATFSDIANEISLKYNFWLGDAFASGGSNGYDHKKMGITAKGGWECVVRHFREIGRNPLKEEFTCIGIGDMSGDVFGNGLLYSNKTKLIFAFNHLHIFVDPNPNLEESFKERERLFQLPSSTWEDYKVLSKGGKIYKRSEEKCLLTPEIKAMFGIKEDEILSTDLIKIALKSEYDLLWNGGIGTYFKASFETNEDAKDKANDVLRINGNELGAKIVGEGGNLGFTQKGRCEFALKGGRINTDAIDNSAGVDCSDHEVNIKILLNSLVSSKKLILEKRNEIIREMTPNVETLVLEDNYNQSLAISLEMMQNKNSSYINFIHHLEKTGRLDRKTEGLSSDEEIQQRGLQRPDFAIILAYAKMESSEALMASNLLSDKYNEKFLISYFPELMKKDFLPEILSHKLSKEIMATVIVNKLVNRAGITFLYNIMKNSNFKYEDIIKAYIVAENLLNLDKVFLDMKNSDYKIESFKQYEALYEVRTKILEPFVLKILAEGLKDDIESSVHHFSKILQNLK